MSLRTRALLTGALLALAAAPAAEAKTPLAKHRVISMKVSRTVVVQGGTVDVYGRTRNLKGRRAGTGRLTYTLRTSRTARTGGRRLGADNVKTTRPRRTRRFFERLTIPVNLAPGVFYLHACVRRGSGAGKAHCRRVRLTVTARPTPPAPPTPPTPPTPPADTRSASEKLRAAIGRGNLLPHLQAFQEIADSNGGNRASGFQGYGASVQYVVSQLRAAGYSPYTQTFSFVVFTETAPPVLEKTAPPPVRTYEPDDDDNDDHVEFITLNYSGAGDTEAPMQAIDVNLAPVPANRTSTSGGEDADFAGFAAGNVALIQRGTCSFYAKVLNAQQAGASGVVIFNPGTAGRTDVFAGTLSETAQDGDDAQPDITIRRSASRTRTASSWRRRTRRTTSGCTSASMRPTTAARPRTCSPTRREATRTAWSWSARTSTRFRRAPASTTTARAPPSTSSSPSRWPSSTSSRSTGSASRSGAPDESGLVGATRYVSALSDEAWEQLAANLNFDMLGSPNHGKFVYDGDFSHTSPPATAPTVNEGAARIEREFVDYFNSQGIPTEPSAFDGRSDYKPFQDTGVPAGGLFSGAEVAKTAEQQAKWQGFAGVAFDPNYHQAGDTIDNLDEIGFEQLADGGAHVAAVLAHDTGLRNVGGGAAASDSAAARRAERSRSVDASKSEWLGSRVQR